MSVLSNDPPPEMLGGEPASVPGWFVALRGHPADLEEWEHALKLPFDPWVKRVPHRNEMLWGLRTIGFKDAADASEVRVWALPLIDRLNGAMAVVARVERVEFDGVGLVRPSGEVNLTFFAEMTAHARSSARVIAEIRDSEGNLAPSPPSKPSAPQGWMQASASNDKIADLLVYAGRADNWFDIYKAIEIAESIAGGEHDLQKLLGSAAPRLKNMRSTANYYRHAPGYYKPSLLITQGEATSLLASVVRTVVFWATLKPAADPGRTS